VFLSEQERKEEEMMLDGVIEEATEAKERGPGAESVMGGIVIDVP
jgi:hypothetical protein